MIECPVDTRYRVPRRVRHIVKYDVVHCFVILNHHIAPVSRRIENRGLQLYSFDFKEFDTIWRLTTVKPLVLLVVLGVLVLEFNVNFFFANILDKQRPEILSKIPPGHSALA